MVQNNQNWAQDLSLAVECSGRTGSVALGIGDAIISKATLSGFQKNSAELLPTVQQLLLDKNLNPDNISHIYIPIGPGSFTGIRIGVTLAKMASFSNKVKIVAVDTLESIAWNAFGYFEIHKVDYCRLASVLDAKRGFFYIALFEWNCGQIKRLSDDMLIRPAEFLEKFTQDTPKVHLLGEGLLYYQNLFESANTVIIDKSLWAACADSVWMLARKKALIGEFTDPNALTPLYIRRPEAEENWEKANRR